MQDEPKSQLATVVSFRDYPLEASHWLLTQGETSWNMVGNRTRHASTGKPASATRRVVPL